MNKKVKILFRIGFLWSVMATVGAVAQSEKPEDNCLISDDNMELILKRAKGELKGTSYYRSEHWDENAPPSMQRQVKVHHKDGCMVEVSCFITKGTQCGRSEDGPCRKTNGCTIRKEIHLFYDPDSGKLIERIKSKRVYPNYE